ncbi:hypothetical protein K490DRAFT_60878 [Saccharata proteae CBS 121410]|uniref:Uncharacterized protein n=1 Tax=Saccharata proteae CBS 121410 TaxID=1314787 RepID=A0A9P4M1Q7_9PEZI|nr:hypothetical protein K490DRAFT_60878 [Saccharata proteae CBS 121410]
MPQGVNPYAGTLWANSGLEHPDAPSRKKARHSTAQMTPSLAQKANVVPEDPRVSSSGATGHTADVRKDSAVSYEHRQYLPEVRVMNHPLSSSGQAFHLLPYPLGLMPYSNWCRLHHREVSRAPEKRDFRCPVCNKYRGEPSAHKQKLFLVAERLSWRDGLVSSAERSLNEELNRVVNCRLGVTGRAAEELYQVPGGEQSRKNQWYPFANEGDFEAAMGLVASADDVTERSWKIWIHMQDALNEFVKAIDPVTTAVVRAQVDEDKSSPVFASSTTTQHTPRLDHAARQRQPLQGTTGNSLRSKQSSSASGKNHQTPSTPRRAQGASIDCPIEIPDSPGEKPAAPAPAPSRHPGAGLIDQPIEIPDSPVEEPPRPAVAPSKQFGIGFRSLAELYSLLDSIERTSFVGARYLEAYAEHLAKDSCQECWSNRNIDPF